MIFERRAALDNGKIPIVANWDLGSQVASAFGYNQIIIKQGEYPVDLSNYSQFGETSFDATFS